MGRSRQRRYLEGIDMSSSERAERTGQQWTKPKSGCGGGYLKTPVINHVHQPTNREASESVLVAEQRDEGGHPPPSGKSIDITTLVSVYILPVATSTQNCLFLPLLLSICLSLSLTSAPSCPVSSSSAFNTSTAANSPRSPSLRSCNRDRQPPRMSNTARSPLSSPSPPSPPRAATTTVRLPPSSVSSTFSGARHRTTDN